jgi:hypothetical protein
VFHLFVGRFFTKMDQGRREVCSLHINGNTLGGLVADNGSFRAVFRDTFG